VRRLCVSKPIEVASGSGGGLEDEEFGGVVGMLGEDEFFEGGKAATGGLEENKNLGSAFEFSLPPVKTEGGRPGSR